MRMHLFDSPLLVLTKVSQLVSQSHLAKKGKEVHPHLLQLGWACFVYFPSEFDPLYVGRDPGAAALEGLCAPLRPPRNAP